jgi:hypothetical protein
MSNSQDFLPKRQRDLRDFGAQALGVLTSGEFNPEVFGLTDQHVADLDALVSEHDTLLAQGDQLREALKANTRAVSGSKGSFARLAAYLRRCASIARASDAPESALLRLNVKRKTLRGSRRNAPQQAPGLLADQATSGTICLRFINQGSASPRARAANTIGVQVAVVDAANPIVSSEEDRVPTISVSRSPARVDTTGWPARVRLYVRWVTPRGEFSGWSAPQITTVR